MSAVCRQIKARSGWRAARRSRGRLTTLRSIFAARLDISNAALLDEAGSATNPATILNSTLLFPAIPKNAPCSLGQGELLQRLEIIMELEKNGSALPAISENHPANHKLQGDPPARPFRF
jgi:hypothetical protein